MKNTDITLGIAESPLQEARRHAQAGNYADMLSACRMATASPDTELAVLLDCGALLLSTGFLGEARLLFERAHQQAPSDQRATANLAHLAGATGKHSESSQLYRQLLAILPNHTAIRRNALTSLEYNADANNSERFAHACAWGDWAHAQAGGRRPRPAMADVTGRPLRLGYVSADLYQHTVGLFVKDVLKAHSGHRVNVTVYSAGSARDWVTEEIANSCTFREVSAMDDHALAQQIKKDAIDVLVDLSGHTGGSRLRAFAYRPAPVQVTWLGYFATTGLRDIDAVLLDEWHAPEGTERYFVEKVVRMPYGRWCYQPVPWAPKDVAQSPVTRNGHVTFGSFNNTAKLNEGVLDVWARVLDAVPHSRLVLKWRTLNDEELRNHLSAEFARRGIDTARLELRGPSFHADLLEEYADIDIALDTFPFTGGLTSCEALWMGVPLISWPQSRVVSRQGLALLSAIGLAEFAARDAEDYVRLASALAHDHARLAALRSTMRERMRASALMNVAEFTRQLEETLLTLHQEIAAEETMKTARAKSLLHVGCGHRNNGAQLPALFQNRDWKEVRLDADPENEPDIVGSMLDMQALKDGSVDAIYSAHNIEHVHTHEVPQVLREFLRVLKADGFLVVTCPDLQTVCHLVAEDKLEDAAYQSPAGPITPLDILFGHGAAIAAGHSFMAHKTGFTLKSLTRILQKAGFQTIAGKRRLRGLDIWAVATKGPMGEEQLRMLANTVLPE